MSQSRENLRTDGRMDERKDIIILFYRTLPAEAGGFNNKTSYNTALKLDFVNDLQSFVRDCYASSP